MFTLILIVAVILIFLDATIYNWGSGISVLAYPALMFICIFPALMIWLILGWILPISFFDSWALSFIGVHTLIEYF